MNKAELVEKVSSQAELSKRDAEAAVEAVFDVIEGALSEGRRSQAFWLWRFCQEEESCS
jgi:DNA-binding protein HU-beta